MFTIFLYKEKISKLFIFSLISLFFFDTHLYAQSLSIKKQLQLNTKKLENHEKLLQTAFDSIKSFVKQYSSVNNKIVEISSQLNSLEKRQENFYNQLLVRLSQIEKYGENEIPTLRNQIDNLDQTYQKNLKQNEKFFSNIDLKLSNSEEEFQSHVQKNASELENISIKLKKILEVEKNMINLADQFSNIVDLNSTTFDTFNEKFQEYDDRLDSNNDIHNDHAESFANIQSNVDGLSNDLNILSEFVRSLENSLSEVTSNDVVNFKTTNDISEIEKDALENLNDSGNQKKLNTYR